MNTFNYRATRIKQTAESDWLVLFGAPATEINKWGGIPQKGEIDDNESIGFQREEDEKRLIDISKFYKNPKNIIQNTLLAATRSLSDEIITFTPDKGTEADACIQSGNLCISFSDFYLNTLLSLMEKLKNDLLKRVPELADIIIPDELKKSIKLRANEKYVGHAGFNSFNDILNDGDGDGDGDEDSDEDIIIDASTVVFEESHIEEFYEQLGARIEVLKEIGAAFTPEEFAGYSKEAIISFLQPVVIVDGQHRLIGAIRAAKSMISESPYMEMLIKHINEGKDPLKAQEELENSISRRLPVSLLMTNDPAEHVFQFIVVNQKATPIGKALLGTIVSSSLSSEELKRVAERLEAAGIPLEDSRAVNFLTKSPSSPFYQLIERGLQDENPDLLSWNVFKSIVNIFRDLKGARPYHSTTRNDYATIYRKKYLDKSELVSDYADKGYKKSIDYWQSFDGPWIQFFIIFWSKVKEKFSKATDVKERNYWGNPNNSNLFNKPSLTILATDFFQYLIETKKVINSFDELKEAIDDWYGELSENYFSRDWQLKNVKKDSTAIRKQWSSIWESYRKNPDTLPPIADYSKNYK